MRPTLDKIVKVQVTNDRINYRTKEDNKPVAWWTGYICVSNTNIAVEHLMTIARAEGKAVNERMLIERIFKGADLGLYTIGEFQFTVKGI